MNFKKNFIIVNLQIISQVLLMILLCLLNLNVMFLYSIAYELAHEMKREKFSYSLTFGNQCTINGNKNVV